MQSLIRIIFLLTILTAAINGIGYSQGRLSSHTPGMRAIDSVAMLMSRPYNFLQPRANLKALPASQNKRMAELFGGIAASKLTGASQVCVIRGFALTYGKINRLPCIYIFNK